MSLTLNEDAIEPIHVKIYLFWESISDEEGLDSLEELYEAGIQKRPADEFLWDLGMNPKNTFTRAEISEIQRQAEIIHTADYPQAVKEAVSELVSLVRKSQFNRNINSKSKNQALRNVYESKTGTSAKPGNGPANIIRNMAGVKVSKGAHGGRQSRKTRKLHKAKKTRRY